MALKRTMVPFYGKPEARLEREVSQVRSRMIAAGASTSEISEAIQYGENELAKMRAKRAKRSFARVGFDRTTRGTRKLMKHLVARVSQTGAGDG